MLVKVSFVRNHAQVEDMLLIYTVPPNNKYLVNMIGALLMLVQMLCAPQRIEYILNTIKNTHKNIIL